MSNGQIREWFHLINEKKDYDDEDLENFTNQLISKITNNLEKFNYNVIIANMYETYNYLISFIKNKKNLNNLENNYKKILICFIPIIPHFANECLSDINQKENIKWPDYDKSALEKNEIKFVIQINGKKRAILNTNKDIDQNDLLKIVKEDKTIFKYLDKKETKKIIFIKNRLLNILTND